MRITNTQPTDPLSLYSSYGASFERISAVAAVAAQSSLAQLSMVGQVGFAVQVVEIWVSLATAGDVVISSYGTNLATNIGAGLSTNFGLNTSGALVKTGNAAAIPGSQLARFSLPVSQSVNVARPYNYILPVNTGLVVAAVTVNVAMTVTWRWMEIVA